MNDKANHWLTMSDYDITTAKAMLKTKRYLYVGYFCHLSVEKLLKAVIVANTNTLPPKIHDLPKLATIAGIFDDLLATEQQWLINLDPMNIAGRYSEYKDSIRKTLSPARCKTLLSETEAFVCMIKQKLGK